jgi:multicomponent Na+:H+ antiporter subunit D
MILAYSTINQLSIALISAFLFTPKGLAAAVIHMVSHSFSKICLFYSAGNFYSSGRTYYLTDLTGINKNMPKTSAIFLVSTLSLIGIPPFAGFISKFYIMLAATNQQNLLVMIVIAISSLFSAFYMLKILGFIYEPVKTKNVNNKEKKLPLFMFISLVLCIISVTCFFFIQQTINIFLNFM